MRMLLLMRVLVKSGSTSAGDQAFAAAAPAATAGCEQQLYLCSA